MALSLLSSFLVGLLAIPLVRWISLRTNKIAQPRKDRWHTRPTPLLGGVAIFIGCIAGGAAIYFEQIEIVPNWPLLLSAFGMFLLGLYDDFRPVNPVSKLVFQLAASIVVIFWGGLVIRFFPWPIANILLTIFWLLGITNGINLLDNMDGIAGGIAMIAAGVLSVQFWLAGDFFPLGMALALVGSTASFLIFNFPPAKIFMGDSGSMFLGFLLASLAILRSQQASNVFAVVAVPFLVFLAPILDTVMVTMTRILRGQSPTQGGTDHTTHRLVAFGLKPVQVALVLYAVAVVGGASSVAIEKLDYDLSLILVPVLIVFLALLTGYLGGLQVVTVRPTEESSITRLAIDLVFRRNLFEILLDVALITISYYLGYWTSYGMDMTRESIDLFLRSWPLAIGVGLVIFKLLGIYRAIWGQISVSRIGRMFFAALAAVLSTVGVLKILDRGIEYPVSVWAFYAIFLLISLAGSRGSYVFLDRLVQKLNNSGEAGEKSRVMIYGLGASGEMALRWLTRFGAYEVVGFIDDDRRLWGKAFFEYPILGDHEKISEFLEKQHIQGIIASDPEALKFPGWQSLSRLCQSKGVWTRAIQISLDAISSDGEND